MSKKIELKSIGIIQSPLKKYSDVPVQPNYSDVKGKIEIFKEYTKALKELDEFEYIICISYLHKIHPPISLQSYSHWGGGKKGVFAIRSPRRPNPIGFSTLKLIKIEGNILYVDNLDLINETPVLDIKPFVPKIDNRTTEKKEWFDQ